MQQVLSVWSVLDSRRRMIVLGASLGVFVAILLLARGVASPSMELLYSGLEPGSAGEVVRALEQRGVPYEVRGAAILVPGARRDELRMTLASEGLPANSAQGYELLDSLSGFSTTAQMFDAAYWRAKEGELARTISSSPLVESARVHIARADAGPFREGAEPTAAITLAAAPGAVGTDQARALRHLVASAVPGLAPENVVVIDGAGQILGGPDEAGLAARAEARADVLRARVMRLLEARVGPGNVVVEVAVQTRTESEAISERRFDPQGRVAISTETEERTDTSRDGAGQGVTVASNLPAGDAGAAGESSSQASETRERVNFEVSETNREILRTPGAVSRITVAVLVNESRETDATGATVTVPRPEEELAALRDLVASAVGFDEARGDVVTLRTLAFEPVDAEGTGPLAPPAFTGIDAALAARIGVPAAVAVILAVFVLRPLLSSSAAARPAELPAPDRAIAGPPPALASGEAAETPALDGEIELGSGFPAVGGFPAMAYDGDATRSEDGEPAERLRRLIDSREAEAVEILRSWMDPRGEPGK